MANDNRISRRKFLGYGAASLAAVAMSDALLGCAHAPADATKGGGASMGYFERFGVDESLIQRGLAAAMSKGADFADLFFQHRVVNQLGLEDGEVNRAYASISLGMGVRAVKGDQTGYAFTEDFSPESIERAALTAAAIATAKASIGNIPIQRTSFVDKSRYEVQTRWEDVALSQKLPILNQLNARALAADPRIQKVSVSLADESGVILVARSDGRVVEDFQPMTSLALSCIAEQNGRRESNSYSLAGRAGIELYSPAALDRVVDRAVQRTLILFDAIQPPAGEMPVVLTAGSSGILLHEAIGHGMEADFNRKGISIYADKIGQSIAPSLITIVDDGTIPGSRGALNVDDEGNPTEKTVLVDKGVLKTFLHDEISARHYGVKPTGNGRRESYAYAPIPRMRATYMENGPHEREEIIASVKKGILCETFTNGQVQIGAGDFTFYVKNGFLIEDGKLTQPIKDVNLIGNGPRVLANIDMVGNDLLIDEGRWTCGKDGQGAPVSQGMPTVRVASLTVGGQG
ncbi:MAG: TldD/PmbA family protein [Myxococcales bacterium]|jgi:TldD protein|nr:TldD/PmbA family protein [Myxococcales bacterium]